MFIVLLKGKGEGCDYTIGCNRNWWTLKATTKEEAINEVANYIEEIGKGESAIGKATILHVNEEIEFDIKGLWKKLDTAHAVKVAEDKAAAELKLYEKLKKQFGE